ncbi:hypothetical protein TRVA0_016S00210 [Trichomonascus vanleenenianus]|uniref:uncharacterized protein n=1 Tax=Trichomonascus vanleenenianus TaxID=2268995 RepID=UPI003ECB15A5
MMGMDMMQSRPNPRPVPSKDKELKEAINDLQKLGLSFYDIQAQCKANPAFLSHVFQSLEMTVPTSVGQPIAPIEPMLRSLIPERSAEPAPFSQKEVVTISSNSTTPRENAAASKSGSMTRNVSRNATPPSLENVAPVRYPVGAPTLEKRKSSPSESSSFGRWPTTAKRARFGDDRWSRKLCIEISDDEDDGLQAVPRAPTPLEVKKAEIKRMTALLEKIEREKKLRERLRNGQGAKEAEPSLATIAPVVQSSPVTPKTESTPLPGATRRAESEGANATTSLELVQLRLRREETLAKRERINQETVALYNKVEGYKKLTLEVERMKRQLMEKMDLKVKADVENVEVEARLSVNKAEQLRIEQDLLLFDQQIKALQETQLLENAQVDAQETDMVASDNDAMDFEEVAPVIEQPAKEPKPLQTEVLADEAKSDVQGESVSLQQQPESHSEDDDMNHLVDSVIVQREKHVSKDDSPSEDDEDGTGTASQPIVLSESSDELEQDQEGDISMDKGPNLKEEPIEVDSLKNDEPEKEAEEPDTSEHEEESKKKDTTTNPLEDEREKFNKEILSLQLEKPKPYRKYESPLRYFRSFKFSPFYDADGGLRSATYNARIPGDKELCESEAQGRPCHNPDCTGFHFKDAVQDDQAILLELSRAFVGETPEQVEEYRKGLATMIIDKKKEQETTTNDDRGDSGINPSLQFENTAEALVEYRRAKAKDRILDWYKFRNIKSKKST